MTLLLKSCEGRVRAGGYPSCLRADMQGQTLYRIFFSWKKNLEKLSAFEAKFPENYWSNFAW